jgi:putative ABC transport system permease protein
MLAVRVLSLFFTLPPPLVSVPVGGIAVLTVSVLAVSTGALAIALDRARRIEVGPVLREP